MTYEEIFTTVKGLVSKGDFSFNDNHYAVEIDIIGEGAGVFYIELANKTVYIEPYDYKDNDCKLIVSGEDFIAISDGSLDSVKAFTTGRLKLEGNIDKALKFSEICDKARKAAIAAMAEAPAPKKKAAKAK